MVVHNEAQACVLVQGVLDCIVECAENTALVDARSACVEVSCKEIVHFMIQCMQTLRPRRLGETQRTASFRSITRRMVQFMSIESRKYCILIFLAKRTVDIDDELLHHFPQFARDFADGTGCISWAVCTPRSHGIIQHGRLRTWALLESFELPTTIHLYLDFFSNAFLAEDASSTFAQHRTQMNHKYRMALVRLCQMCVQPIAVASCCFAKEYSINQQTRWTLSIEL